MHRYLWLLIPMLLVSPVMAQSDSLGEVERVQAAAEQFDLGRRAYNSRDYTTAAEHFEAADRQAPAPEALRMAIRSRSAAKQYDRAATLSASALQRYPDDQQTRALAEGVLNSHEKKLYKVRITCDESCALLLDRKIVPLQEIGEAVVYMDPGSHELTAGWSGGRTQIKNITAVEGGFKQVQFQAPALPSEEPETKEPLPEVPDVDFTTTTDPVEPEPAPEESTGGWWTHPALFWSSFGLTAALTGVTIWSGVDMINNPGKDKVREDCAGKTSSCPTYEKAISAQNRTNALIVTSSIMAGITAIIGIGLTDFSGSSSDTTKGATRIGPTITFGDGVGLQASGRF